MQHVEEAGIHSGDSACVLPPHSLGHDMLDLIREQTRGIALGLGVVGLLNVQFAVHGGGLHVIEANPRASRTVPFVSKAVGVPLAKMACRIMLGERLADLDLPGRSHGRPARERQGGRAALRPLRGRRCGPRPGDALHRRGHGDRARLPDRVRQGPGRRGRDAPDRGDGVHHGDRQRQGGGRRRGAVPARPRVPDRGDARHARGARAHGHPRAGAAQDRGGLAERRRLDRARRRRPGRQHADGLRRAHGRLGDPPRGGRARASRA